MTIRPDDPAVLVWRRLLQFHRRATATLDAELATKRDLSLEEYDVLFQLHDAGSALRMSDLAEAVLVSRSSCTRLVDRLVGRGLVERVASDHDRRSITVSMTTAGRATLRRAAATHLRGIDSLFASRLDAADLADLERILVRLG
jgi:DNA-binding MarR family transcriptional regulator